MILLLRLLPSSSYLPPISLSHTFYPHPPILLLVSSSYHQSFCDWGRNESLYGGPAKQEPKRRLYPMAYNYCPYSAYAHKKGSEHPNHNTPLPVAALETTRSWRARDTIWAPRQRQGGGGVCPEDSGGLDRQAFSLGQQVFDAEIFAIYHALRIFQARQKSGRRYTVFSDSPSAIR